LLPRFSFALNPTPHRFSLLGRQIALNDPTIAFFTANPITFLKMRPALFGHIIRRVIIPRVGAVGVKAAARQ
jgi:hypothetical protein